MALTVIGGSNFVGRYLIGALASQYSEVRLGDMYPFRQAVYRLQEQLQGKKVVKHALSYPTSLKLALAGAEHVVVVTHDYFQLAHSKNFFLERTAFFAKEFKIPRLTYVCPMELIQLNPLDGDPHKLAAESEKKAKSLYPGLSILRTNLIFGGSCTSLVLQHTLEALSHGESPLYSRDGISKFQPVHDSEVLAAFNGLKPGEEVSLSGPEVLSWAEVVSTLKKHTGGHSVSVGGTLEALRESVATNPYFGDLFFPSQINQLYRVLQKDMTFPPTATGSKKLSDYYTPNSKFQPIQGKNWHRTILD